MSLLDKKINRRDFMRSAAVMGAAAASSSMLKLPNVIHAAPLSSVYNKRYDGVTVRVCTLRDISGEIALKKIPELTAATGIKVEPNMLEFGEMVNTEKMDFVAGAGAWDVVAIDQPSLGEYVTSGWVYPLTEFINNKDLPDAKVSDFIPAIINGAGIWEGVYYAFPMGSYGNLFGYRKDLYDKAGLAKPPDTWEDFLAQAQALNHPPDLYGTTLYAKRGEYLSYDAAAYLWSYGSGFIDDKHHIMWDSAQGLEALTFYADLILKHKVVPPGCLDYGHQEFTQAFQTGLVAMGVMIQESIGAPMEDATVSKVAGKMAYGPVPGKKQPDGKILRTPCIGAHSLAINANSKNKEAAYVVAQFMTSQGEDYMLAGGKPTRLSHFSYASVNTKYPFMKAIGDNMPLGRTRPNIPEYPSVSEIFSTAFHGVLSGQAPLETAMKSAAQDASKILAKAYPKDY
jgi:multiple sugar transport system substrate-binding protein